MGIIGLGYVGLPLAVEFGKYLSTIGFDTKSGRIDELRSGRDSTLEVDAEGFRAAERLGFTNAMDDLSDCRVYIVTVPTPVDKYKQPDLSPLESASATVGKVLKRGDVVVYESTVFPGATEEVCVPILERASELKLNVDFFAGYSPE